MLEFLREAAKISTAAAAGKINVGERTIHHFGEALHGRRAERCLGDKGARGREREAYGTAREMRT
jgi:hypothetical protein